MNERRTRLALSAVVFASVVGITACTHFNKPSRVSDCRFYEQLARDLKRPDFLAPNVDPEIARAAFARDAAVAGCSGIL